MRSPDGRTFGIVDDEDRLVGGVRSCLGGWIIERHTREWRSIEQELDVDHRSGEAQSLAVDRSTDEWWSDRKNDSVASLRAEHERRLPSKSSVFGECALCGSFDVLAPNRRWVLRRRFGRLRNRSGSSVAA